MNVHARFFPDAQNIVSFRGEDILKKTFKLSLIASTLNHWVCDFSIVETITNEMGNKNLNMFGLPPCLNMNVNSPGDIHDELDILFHAPGSLSYLSEQEQLHKQGQVFAVQTQDENQ